MPTFSLILACAFWGLSFPVIKFIQLEQTTRLEGASATFLAAWLQFARFSVATLILLPFLFGKPWIRKREWQQGALLGLFGGLGMGLQAWGLNHTEASTSAFFTQAYCVILPVVACFRHRSWPGRRTVTATLLVVGGGAILAGISHKQLSLGLGETATLAAACAFTAQILVLDHAGYRENRALPITLIMCLVTAAGYLPISLLTANHPSLILTAAGSWTTLWCLLILAIVCTIGAYLLINANQPKVSATEAGLIYTTEPIFAAGFALFVPGLFMEKFGIDYANEVVNSRMLIGGGLIVLANALMQWKSAPHPPSVAPIP